MMTLTATLTVTAYNSANDEAEEFDIVDRDEDGDEKLVNMTLTTTMMMMMTMRTFMNTRTRVAFMTDDRLEPLGLIMRV